MADLQSWKERASAAVGRLSFSFYDPATDRGSVQLLTLRVGKRTGEKMAILNVSGNPHNALTRSQITRFKETLLQTTSDPLSIYLRISQKEGQHFEMHLAGPEHYREILYLPEPFTFCISPTTPFPDIEDKIQARVKKGFDPAQTVIVPNCGAGAWALAVAPHVKKVIGLDENPYAFLDAKQNTESVQNIIFHRSTLEDFLDSERGKEYNGKDKHVEIL